MNTLQLFTQWKGNTKLTLKCLAKRVRSQRQTLQLLNKYISRSEFIIESQSYKATHGSTEEEIMAKINIVSTSSFTKKMSWLSLLTSANEIVVVSTYAPS